MRPPALLSRRSLAFALGALTLTGLAAQLTVFQNPLAPEHLEALNHPAVRQYAECYSPALLARASAFESAVFWGGTIALFTSVCGLLTFLATGFTRRFCQSSAARGRIWILRIFFFAAVFLGLQISDLPFRYVRFERLRELGLTSLSTSNWIQLLLAGLPVSLFLFVLKYLFVTCTLAIWPKRWWLMAALGLFLIKDVVPEWTARNVPLDPVERVTPMPPGPHFETMRAVLQTLGKDLPLMVVDESQRSKSASICLTGRAGREYVLVTDTFLERYSPSEAAVALAHELGHLKSRLRSILIDKSYALALGLLIFGLTFVLAGRGKALESSAPRVVTVALVVSSCVSTLCSPIGLALSRAEERRADQYALEVTHDVHALPRLVLKSAQHELLALTLPNWQYYFSASHPTPLERVAAAASRAPLQQ